MTTTAKSPKFIASTIQSLGMTTTSGTGSRQHNVVRKATKQVYHNPMSPHLQAAGSPGPCTPFLLDGVDYLSTQTSPLQLDTMPRPVTKHERRTYSSVLTSTNKSWQYAQQGQRNDIQDGWKGNGSGCTKWGIYLYIIHNFEFGLSSCGL